MFRLPELPKLPKLPDPRDLLAQLPKPPDPWGLLPPPPWEAGGTPDAAKPIEAPPEPQHQPQAIARGTACTVCGKDHFSVVAGGLAEAMRFARDGGIEHPEVIRRIQHCEDELNTFERWDGSPVEVAKLSPGEKPIIEEMLVASRNLRHQLSGVRDVAGLETVAADAGANRREFGARLFRLGLSGLPANEKVET